MLFSRGGNFGPTRWANPVHSELGSGWVVKLLAQKNRVKFGLARPPKYFLCKAIWPDLLIF